VVAKKKHTYKHINTVKSNKKQKKKTLDLLLTTHEKLNQTAYSFRYVSSVNTS